MRQETLYFIAQDFCARKLCQRTLTVTCLSCSEVEAKGKGKLRTALVPESLDVSILDEFIAA